MSASGNHDVVFQPDGNLVVYTTADQFVWGLNTVVKNLWRVKTVVKQIDGTLVAYGDDGAWVWSARDVPSPDGSKLDLDPQGRLQIVAPLCETLWSGNG